MSRTEDTTISTRLGGRRYWLTLQARDAELVGVAITYHAAESGPMSSLLNIAARTATLALENGATADDIVDVWLGVTFEPRGRVNDARGGSYYTHSVLDWAAREIGATCCGRLDLVGQVPKE